MCTTANKTELSTVLIEYKSCIGVLDWERVPAVEARARIEALARSRALILSVRYDLAGGSVLEIAPLHYERGIPTTGLIQRWRSPDPDWRAAIRALAQAGELVPVMLTV